VQSADKSADRCKQAQTEELEAAMDEKCSNSPQLFVYRFTYLVKIDTIQKLNVFNSNH
jgi:hypothetical protein